jgi:hypothetical protein
MIFKRGLSFHVIERLYNNSGLLVRVKVISIYKYDYIYIED